MYTYDGLWYNICFFDVVGIVAAIVCIIIGASGIKKKRKKDAKGLLVFGILAVLVASSMLISDIRSIQQENFRTTTGTFNYYHRAHRQAPFTGEYTFATEDSDLLKNLYLDAFTLRKHLGPGYELTPGAVYEITYDASSDVIVGLKELSN